MTGFPFTRRHFFYGSLLAGAIPAGGFGSAPSLKEAGYKSPNEKLNIAAIGAGGRAADDINGCSSENMVAFTDPDSVSAAGMFSRYPKAPRYTDFRKMLDKEANGIDAVIVAIPDFMHGTAANWCMERGKHVYVEKPLTHTPWEARQLAASAAKYGVATQMGNQGYSNNGARVAAEILWSGEIGNVTEVHAWTNRPIWPQGMTQIPPATPAPATLDWDSWIGIQSMRPYAGVATTPEEGASPGSGGGGGGGGAQVRGFYNPFNWRGFFEFGCGPLGDMACHILGAVNMALMLGSPTSVQVIKQEGTSTFAFPKKSVTVFEFPARHNMPPVKVYWYDAAKGPMYRPTGIPEDEPLIGGPGSFGQEPRAGFGGGRGGAGRGGRAGAPTGAPAGAAAGAPAVVTPGRGGQGPRIGSQDNGAVFVGDKGVMTTDTYGAAVRLLPASRQESYTPPPQILTRSPGHYRDWIRACKGGEPACSNFSVSGPFTEWIVMGVIALRFEGKLEWDAGKMQFTNNAAANAYVKPTFRRGWSFT
ncbi:MAG: Gfo/Idh/MocA family oxidoreductase [Bryobacteraceae bacterium]|jgi:predicted dehydrogenase